tara:strand:- start:1645 stop:1995 length:351 start_codon:yes stop_codon:yes gene_type:complete
MSNSEPDMFEIAENKRQGITVKFYYKNIICYLNAQYDNDWNLRVVRLFPKLKYGTDMHEMLKELSDDLTFRLQCYKDPGDALARMKSSVLRKGDGTPTTFRGAIIDRLFEDPYLEK